MAILKSFFTISFLLLRRGIARKGLLAAIGVAASLCSASAQAPSAEYKLKAVFLYNFVQYVDWPKDSHVTDDSPWVIGVLGSDPFGKILEETVQGEMVKQRKLEIRRYDNVEAIRECHVLFISSSETKNLPRVMETLKGKSILTVSDIDNFAKKYGGMVWLYPDGGKIHFQINIDAAKAAQLFISSKLLQLAKVVHSGDRP